MQSPKWSTKFFIDEENPGSKPWEIAPNCFETPSSANLTEELQCRHPLTTIEKRPPQTFQLDDLIVPDFKQKEKWLQLLSNGTLSHHLSVLHRMIQAEDTRGIFGYPVTDEIAPEYSHYVKKPMDFATMQSKIKRYTSFSEYYEDLTLVFNNALLYNNEGSLEHNEAMRMKCAVFKCIQSILEKKEKRKQRPQCKANEAVAVQNILPAGKKRARGNMKQLIQKNPPPVASHRSALPNMWSLEEDKRLVQLMQKFIGEYSSSGQLFFKKIEADFHSEHKGARRSLSSIRSKVNWLLAKTGDINHHEIIHNKTRDSDIYKGLPSEVACEIENFREKLKVLNQTGVSSSLRQSCDSVAKEDYDDDDAKPHIIERTTEDPSYELSPPLCKKYQRSHSNILSNIQKAASETTQNNEPKFHHINHIKRECLEDIISKVVAMSALVHHDRIYMKDTWNRMLQEPNERRRRLDDRSSMCLDDMSIHLNHVKTKNVSAITKDLHGIHATAIRDLQRLTREWRLLQELPPYHGSVER